MSQVCVNYTLSFVTHSFCFLFLASYYHFCVSEDGWETWRTVWTLRGMFCANLLVLPYLYAILCQIPWSLGFWEEILLCMGILSCTQQSYPGPIFSLSFSIFFPGLSVMVSVYTPATTSHLTRVLTHPYTCGDLRRQEVGCFHFTLNESESEVTQWCPTLCDPMDSNTPCSAVHGIFQARIWSGLPFPSPDDLPTQGSNPGLLHCRQTLYHLSHQGSPTLNISP